MRTVPSGIALASLAQIELANAGRVAGGRLSLLNAGEIEGSAFWGHGVVLAREFGADETGEATNDGVINVGTGAAFGNYGRLKVVNADAMLGLNGAGLVATHVEDLSLVDDGRIAGFSGFDATSGRTVVDNSGASLGGADGYGVVAAIGDEAPTLRNDGRIAGGAAAAQGDDELINGGRMLGDVLLDAGADLFVNDGGRVSGAVRLGAGEDRFDGGDGLAKGPVHGEEDDGALLGSLVPDDLLFGGEGGDFVAGRGGDDELRGDAGDDALVGGRGEDALFGGDGEDVFRIVRRAGDDAVMDFEDGDDRIDLRPLALEGSGKTVMKKIIAASHADGPEAIVIDLARLGGDGVPSASGLSLGKLAKGDFLF